MKLHEHIVLVELAAEERLQTEFAKVLVGLRTFRERVLERCLLREALLHLGELQHHARILDRLREGRERHDVRALRVRRRDDLLGLRLVVPEIARSLLLLKRGQFLTALVDLDVVGHLADLTLQLFDSLPDLFDFQQLLFALFCHNVEYYIKSRSRSLNTAKRRLQHLSIWACEHLSE